MSSTEHCSQHTVLVLAQSGSPCHEAMSSNVNRNNSWNLLPIVSLKSYERFSWSTFTHSVSKSRIFFQIFWDLIFKIKSNGIPVSVLFLFEPFGEKIQKSLQHINYSWKGLNFLDRPPLPPRLKLALAPRWLLSVTDLEICRRGGGAMTHETCRVIRGGASFYWLVLTGVGGQGPLDPLLTVLIRCFRSTVWVTIY